MGNCLAKIRNDKTLERFPSIDSVEIVNHNVSSKKSEELNIELPTRRQMEYWQRRKNKICTSDNQFISARSMNLLFNYLNLSEETIKKLHQIFKNDKELLDSETFFEGIRMFGSSSNEQISSVIYKLYFESDTSPELLLSRFQIEFIEYVKSPTENEKVSEKISRERKIEKLKQLKPLLEKRKHFDDSNEVEKFLLRSMNFKKFKTEFLEGGLQEDEKEALSEFYYDYNQQDSKMWNSNIVSTPNISDNKFGEVNIISERWCDKMMKYMNERFENKGSNFLVKKKTSLMDSSMYMMNLGKKKESIDSRRMSIDSANGRSSINEYNSLKRGRRESDELPKFEISPMKLNIRKHEDSFHLQSFPGEIDNSALMGNFEWELKRNIRKDVDYITLKESTYDKLVMCFGGGPKFSRKTMNGYIELRPYFVQVYTFHFNEGIKKEGLNKKELISISPNDPIKNFLNRFSSKNILYHRNVGSDWEKLSFNSIEDNNKKIDDFFTETSFVFEIPISEEKRFTNFLKERRNEPIDGDMFVSKTYKLIDASAGAASKSETIEVCVIESTEPGFVNFCLLNGQNHLKRKLQINEFNQHFKFINNNLRNTVVNKKNRAGIANLGNTCYMNASLQSIISVCKDEQLESPKGELAVELYEIAVKIRDKKKSVFPVKFKTIFDKYFNFFKGQDQHDAHEFIICLFDQFEQDNKKLMQNNFKVEVKMTNKCKKCLKVHESIAPSYIIELPLRDFDKQESKIDYISDNKTIQTVTFSIEENSKVIDWKRSFEKATKIENYYLCEIENSKIIRTFNKDDKVDSLDYADLRIEKHLLITAYETKLWKTNLKIKKFFDFRTYKDKLGNVFVAKIEEDTSYDVEKPLNSMNELNDKKYQARIKSGSNFEEKVIADSDLFNFPENFPVKETFIIVTNYDRQYKEKFGRPFVFKLLNHSPISAVREAIENCIGNKGYSLRVASLDDPEKCEICKKYDLRHEECFRQRESYSPICWVEGMVDFLAVWDDVSIYNSLMKRIKYEPLVSKNNTQDEYDYFEMSLKKSEKVETLEIDKCDYCQEKNVAIDHREQIYHWPNILIIHLKRFTIKKGEIKKIHTKWKLEESLFINKDRYNLKAVICHIGTSADYGHYVAVAGGTMYDDELVSNMSFEGVSPESIYMLFYQKVDA